jgi:formylmethanofuran dehydrogenase subunit B
LQLYSPTIDQILEYTATVEAEVKNNIAPASPVRIDHIYVEVGDKVSKVGKTCSNGCCKFKTIKTSVGKPRN